MDLGIKGRAALVCGASRGIGFACAEKLAAEGVRVMLLARDEAALAQACAKLPTPDGQKHAYVACDLLDEAQIVQAGTVALEKMGPLYILVNNSGGPKAGPLVNAGVQEFKDAFGAHLLANHLLMQTMVTGMKELGGGRIVNIISTSVKQPILGLGVSNTVRAAVGNWAKTLAAELGAFGITVNNLLPGATRTSRLEAIIAGKAAQRGVTVAEQEALEMEEIALRRFATAEEIGGVVSFLCSVGAGYVTGTNIVVDGGRTRCL